MSAVYIMQMPASAYGAATHPTIALHPRDKKYAADFALPLNGVQEENTLIPSAKREV